MSDSNLAAKLSELVALPAGHAGICAETLDGSQRIELHADEVFPAASSIKLFVLYTLLVKVDANELALANRVEFSKKFARRGSGVLRHLDPGLQPTLKDIATLMMMISDNSALNMLTDHLGQDRINAEITRLGLEHTFIGDWSNFAEAPIDSMALGTSTPRAMVGFLLRMQRGELLTPAAAAIFWDILRIQKYIEPLRRFLPASPWWREFNRPEPVWVASKSGSLDDCSTESGFIRVNDGGWAISVMTREMPNVCADPHNPGEKLISDTSRLVYDAWSPLYA